MKILLITLLTFLSSNVSLAKTNMPPHIHGEDLVGFLMEDFNDDGALDKAVLVRGNEDVDLYIYLSDDSGEMKLVVYNSGIVWSGIMYGTVPSLTQHPKTKSIILEAGNQAIGRGRWIQKLTISYRDDEFVVSGFTHESYDTLDPENSHSCDYNLLTGKAVVDKKPAKLIKKHITLEDWDQALLPEVCIQ
ncbi:MAG: Unknown protein [uncultured Thiotrichaceae bacterium]|uniref:VCBS repeat-containing protein n=1 Tax=uncultured Thiotrichaceae bacterium TaxID=298394 RepID=A0A6S6S3P2_9GAMM|nr:MAG: Unknown protein [uncultured Thiotrichaceae bacterium]